MNPSNELQLAWYSLTRDWLRFSWFVAGVAIVVWLIFLQLGFLNALLNSNTLLIEHLNADLLLVSSSRRTLVLRDAFSRRRLFQAASLPQVHSVHPLYIDYHLASLRPAADRHDDRGP